MPELKISDHTAILDFCLRNVDVLRGDGKPKSSVDRLRDARKLAEGTRIRKILANAIKETLLGADHSSIVSVLGGFHLWWSGSVQASIPRASQRLLGFLAIRGVVTSRAAVAGTFWPDATETHAYSNLRSALARRTQPARSLHSLPARETTAAPSGPRKHDPKRSMTLELEAEHGA